MRQCRKIQIYLCSLLMAALLDMYRREIGGANGRKERWEEKKSFPLRAIIHKIFISFNEFLIGFLLKGIISRNIFFG